MKMQPLQHACELQHPTLYSAENGGMMAEENLCIRVHTLTTFLKTYPHMVKYGQIRNSDDLSGRAIS